MTERVRKLAEAAGREIMKVYVRGDSIVNAKSDSSPVAEADLAANRILVEGLSESFSEPIISEEGDPSQHQIAGRFWLVDPLDGTRDFIAKLDTFVVCVALIQSGEAIFGLIHSPVTGESWWANKGEGAFHSSGRRLMHLGTGRSLIAAGSRSTTSPRMESFFVRFEDRFKDRFNINEVRRYGSALKFCKLAEGDIDLYPRFGPTFEWDTAAGQIIAEEAGCKVTEISTGQRLSYGKEKFANAGGFIASRGDLEIVSVLRDEGWLKR